MTSYRSARTHLKIIENARFPTFQLDYHDRPTDRPIDRQMDKASYRVACPQLKTKKSKKLKKTNVSEKINVQIRHWLTIAYRLRFSTECIIPSALPTHCTGAHSLCENGTTFAHPHATGNLGWCQRARGSWDWNGNPWCRVNPLFYSIPCICTT